MSDLIRRSVLIDEICRSSIYKWSVEEDQAAHNWALNIINSQPSVESSKGDLISRADAIEAVASITMSIHLSDVICDKLLALPSADAVSEDTQTEEQARFVAKETELAHIEARLENAEKRLQGVCVANFVAEQLDRLRNMTDEERWDFFIRFFRPSADAVYGKWLPIEETIPTYDGGEKTRITGMKCSNCGKLLDLRVGYYYCPNCGARMKGGDTE